MNDITALLERSQSGGNAVMIGEIVAILYPELRRLAHRKLAANSPITLLDTTSMVHEAYERLCRADGVEARCRGQFMAYASKVMGSILVDFARQRLAQRRGGAAEHVTLDTGHTGDCADRDEEVVRVHDALLELEQIDPRLKQIVEMRYFVGYTIDEIAEALGLSAVTVGRDWARAKMLLSVSIQR